MNGKLNGAARRASAAVQGQNLFLVAQQHDRSGLVFRRVILPQQLPKAGVFAVGLQRPLDLDLRVHAPGHLETGNPVRDPKQGRIPSVSVAGHENQIARLGSLKHRGQQDQRLGRPGVSDRIPECFLHTGSSDQIPDRAKRPVAPFGWERQSPRW